MSQQARNIIITLLWAICVLTACWTLYLAVRTFNGFFIVAAAVLAFVAKWTSPMVPIAQIYQEQGVTEETFSNKIRSAYSNPESGKSAASEAASLSSGDEADA